MSPPGSRQDRSPRGERHHRCGYPDRGRHREPDRGWATPPTTNRRCRALEALRRSCPALARSPRSCGPRCRHDAPPALGRRSSASPSPAHQLRRRPPERRRTWWSEATTGRPRRGQSPTAAPAPTTPAPCWPPESELRGARPRLAPVCLSSALQWGWRQVFAQLVRAPLYLLEWAQGLQPASGWELRWERRLALRREPAMRWLDRPSEHCRLLRRMPSATRPADPEPTGQIRTPTKTAF